MYLDQEDLPQFEFYIFFSFCNFECLTVTILYVTFVYFSEQIMCFCYNV
jgi:hypothetical protein